jgi:membrane protease YdiL (CAAX protease family)
MAQQPNLTPFEGEGDPDRGAIPHDPSPSEYAALASRDSALPGSPEPSPESAPQGWTYGDILVVVGFAILTQLLVNIGLFLVVLAVGWVRGVRSNPIDLMTSASVLLPVQLVWWILIFWIIYRIVRARDRRPFAQAIGWVWPQRPAGTYILGGALLAVSVGAFSALLPQSHRKMPMEELFRDPKSIFLLALFGVLIAPPIEELLFRGFLFPVVERSHGSAAAIGVTAALFSLVHAAQYGWAWQNLLLLGYVGVVFGAVRAATHSLVPSTLMHAAYNFTLFAGLYAASDHFRHLNF